MSDLEELYERVFAERVNEPKEYTERATDGIELKNILKKFIENDKQYTTEEPFELKKGINKQYKQFNGFDQKDAFEFFSLFMEALSSELNRVKTKPPYTQLKQDSFDYNKLVNRIVYIE